MAYTDPNLPAVISALEGSEFKFKEIYAVYNEHLLASWADQKTKLVGGKADAKKNWASAPDADKREWVMKFLDQKVKSWPWNSSAAIPVLPAVHCTTAADAWEIVANGFGSESAGNTDTFGKGPNFTTSLKYAHP